MHYEPSADGIMWEVKLTDISYPPQEKHMCVEIGWITEIDDFTNYNSLHNGHGVRVAWLHNEAQRYGIRVPKYGANSGKYKGIIIFRVGNFCLGRLGKVDKTYTRTYM